MAISKIWPIFVSLNVKDMIDETKYKKFEKNQRSSFSYWFNHWKAFNGVARELGAWKFKYLFHDIEKPWLKLLWGDYKKVQRWHREHNAHHLEYKKRYTKGYDYEAMVIDWECSRYTKVASPRTAIEEINLKLDEHEITENEYWKLIKTANSLGLTK